MNRMKPVFSILAIVLFLAACSPTKSDRGTLNDANSRSVMIEKIWQTDTVFRVPESVVYDRRSKLLYVSNIDGKPWDNDSTGFISQIDLEGKVVDLQWITGLNGPKGMAVSGEYLYVADNDALKKFTLPSGELMSSFETTFDEPKLNDVTAGTDGSVYVSASELDKVFLLQDDELIVFAEENFGRINGLWVDETSLFVLGFNSNEMMKLDLRSKSLKRLVSDIGNADGIEQLSDGSFLTSHWGGAIYHVSSAFEATKVLDTEKVSVGAADIAYIASQEMLLVPTFFDNRVMAYRVRYTEQ